VSEVSRLTRWNEEVHRSLQEHKTLLLQEDVLSFLSDDDEALQWGVEGVEGDGLGLDVRELDEILDCGNNIYRNFCNVAYECHNSGAKVKDFTTGGSSEAVRAGKRERHGRPHSFIAWP
jgi:hypothetical protein